MGWRGITTFLVCLLVVVNAYRVRNIPVFREGQKTTPFRKGWSLVELPSLVTTTTFRDADSETALSMALDAPIKSAMRRGGSSMITSGWF